MSPDSVDRRLLGMLQKEFPLTGKPYADLGQGLGVAEDGVIERIERMKSSGLVRQISPVIDARRLGYKTTLVAMRAGEAQLERAAGLLAEHPGVSHAYERDHHFNLWFTLAAPDGAGMDSELSRLSGAIEAEAAFELPAVKVFKLRTYFGPDGDNAPQEQAGTPDGASRQSAPLSPPDRAAINELQQDLPLVPRPFAGMSSRLGMDEEDFLALCRSLLSRGIIRRYGASVNHRGAGFAGNAMTCWAVPEEMVGSIAEKLVPLRQVSHCYQRKTNPLWRYNVFAMIHGHTGEECQEVARKVAQETGLADYVLLFSSRELKKTRVIYRV